MKIIIDFENENLKDLNINEMVVYSYIKSFGVCGTYTPISELSKLFKMTRPTLTKIFNKLVEMKLVIKKDVEHYRNNLYICVECLEEQKEQPQEQPQEQIQDNDNKVVSISRQSQSINNQVVNEMIEEYTEGSSRLETLFKQFIDIRTKRHKVTSEHDIMTFINQLDTLRTKDMKCQCLSNAVNGKYIELRPQFVKDTNKSNKFNNFTQREYTKEDFNELEKSFFA